MGKLSRSKGHKFEREVARLISEATRRKVVRVLTEPREGNSRGDLDCGDLPLTIQCKVGQRPNIAQAVREAVVATPDGNYSAAIVRKNGKNQHDPSEDTVTMPLSDWLEWLELLTGHRVW